MIARIWYALLAAAPVKFWASTGCALVMTALATGLVWIVWKGPWPMSQAGRQLDILGKALWTVLVIIGAVVLSFAGQKISAKGLGGSSIDIGNDAAPQVVTTTTKTEVG